MQVSVERTSELERKMTVELPGEIIKDKVETRIKDLAKEAKIDGFRPGMVPQRIIRHRFGNRLREEVLGELIKSSFEDAIVEQKMNIAGKPSIVPENLDDGGFKYIASFEIFPEISLADMSQLQITRPVVEVTDGDIEDTIERLRRQKATWNKVDREAKAGDRVTISYTGLVDDKDFTDGGLKDHHLILGSNTMIPGFEDNLVGTKADEKIEFKLDFPDDASNNEFAGKTANFVVEVSKVEEIELPAVDETFIKGFGKESGELEAFRSEIKEHLQRDLNNPIRAKVKTSTMNALLDAHEIQAPRALVDQELEELLSQINRAEGKSTDNSVSEDVREKANEQAIRRVKLGLLLGEIVKVNGIKADKDRVRKTITSLAQSYEDPESVISWYYSQPQQLVQIEQMVLEDLIIDWLMARAQVTDEPVKFSEFMHDKTPGLVQSS